MSKFIARSKKGKLSLGSEYNRDRFQVYLNENEGILLDIKPKSPESYSMRKFFEGGIVPLACFYQENLDHRNPDDVRDMRERLKLEFNGRLVPLGAGDYKKVPKSSKGSEQLRALIDRIMDWMAEQGYQVEWLNPEEYKTWRDLIRDGGGPDNFIDYLVETGRLSKS